MKIVQALKCKLAVPGTIHKSDLNNWKQTGARLHDVICYMPLYDVIVMKIILVICIKTSKKRFSG